LNGCVRALKWTAGLIAVFILAALLFVVFGLHLLKGPITRAVSEATGRELVIEGDLRAAWSLVHPRFRAERIRFSNPGWAADDQLLTAEALEASISVLPLLAGRVVVPQAHLEKPVLSLEQDAQGRRTWVLDEDPEPGKESRFHIAALTLDRGRLRYRDAGRAIDLQAELSSGDGGVNFEAKGEFNGLPLIAAGHGGPVLQLRGTEPYPLKAAVRIGASAADVDGRITELVGLKGIDTQFTISGNSMEELYDIVGVALPNTSPYRTSGRLVREGSRIRWEGSGKVGESDIAGTIELETAGERPFMQGTLQSKLVNLADLGAVVGANQPRKDGVLPEMPFEPARWDSVDADVTLTAARIKRPEQLPIEKLSARIRMKDRVLTLDPLEFGIAGGRLAGTVRLDGTQDAIRAGLKMRVERLQLARLFPTIEQNQTSVGDVGGLVELDGTGNSVGRMLGSADGKVGLFMDGGRISRFMMELVALDLWDVAKLKLQGDEPIGIRCAIADFAVKGGVMQANALVFDTDVVLVEGAGTVDLKSEAMDLKLNPKPKDNSIASLNSPLFVGGTFSKPAVSPDVGKLAARGVGAIVMGIINPLLAVLPLFKEGKGENSNCGQLIAQAAKPKATQQTRQAAKPAANASTGGSRAPGR
jgi:AsmA protein